MAVYFPTDRRSAEQRRGMRKTKIPQENNGMEKQMGEAETAKLSFTKLTSVVNNRVCQAGRH